MPQGEKSKYTSKQKRKAEHIEEGYEKKGLSETEAERRAWATVNKQDGGGKKAGGSGRPDRSRKSMAARKDSARRAAKTRTTGRRAG